MIRKFVEKMLRANSEEVREYIKEENTIFIEHFTEEQLKEIKEFADDNVYITDNDLDSFTSMYGVYEGLKLDMIRFYILTDYMESYVWEMHDRGERLVYRDFRRKLKERNDS